jgi:hypothetical protein
LFQGSASVPLRYSFLSDPPTRLHATTLSADFSSDTR